MEIVGMKSKPTVANVAMTAANTEYSYELPAGTRSFSVKLRNPGYPLQLCVVAGESNTTYVNLAQGETYTVETLKGKGTILYFRTTAANQTCEILIFR